jgi:hypothetical protein
MPCRDDRDDCPSPLEERARGRLSAQKELEPLLCEAMTALDNLGKLPGQFSPELLKWYADHSEQEKHRLRLEAVQKLTEKERRLLGIDLLDYQNALALSKFPK